MKRFGVSAILSVWVLITLIVAGCAADAKSYFNRGLTYHKKGQYDQAISEYNRAIAINPRYAKAYSNRGAAYMDKGQHDRAISDFTKAIEINPKLALARNQV